MRYIFDNETFYAKHEQVIVYFVYVILSNIWAGHSSPKKRTQIHIHWTSNECLTLFFTYGYEIHDKMVKMMMIIL